MSALYDQVKAAMMRIGDKDKSLPKDLEKAVGYAVFPAVGRAGLVLGGAYGQGVVFNTKEALDRFKRGRIAFTANASAVAAKAAASGTSDYETDVIAKAYSQGGMLLEASLGGQGFRFKPKAMLETPKPEAEKKPEPEKKAG